MSRPVFELTLVAAPEHIDELGHVNNAVWVQWIQQVAVAHWDSAAHPAHKDAYHWVVVRHEIDYRRALLPGETAFGRTWVSDTAEGPRFNRFIRIDAEDGAMCAQAVTTWVLIEQATGKPKRVPPWMLEMFA